MEMTEQHECEWYIIGEGVDDVGIYCGAMIDGKQCVAYMTSKQAEARLNATERLSAQDAMLMHLLPEKLQRLIHKEYAAILEGKC